MNTKTNANIVIDSGLFTDVRVALITARTNFEISRDNHARDGKTIMADHYQNHINNINKLLDHTTVNYSATVRANAFAVVGV